MPSAIESRRHIAAPPELVHHLLTDVESWALWSPHIASVKPSSGSIGTGWRGEVRAWFSPRPVAMIVDDASPGHGLRWHSRALAHSLRYENAIEPDGRGGSNVRFTARVEGPLGDLATTVARPLSGLGQRRRLARLDRLARLLAVSHPPGGA